MPWLASALLFNAAFPPFNFGLLVFAALAPWLVALSKGTPRSAVRSGFGFGLATYAIQLCWLQPLAQKWTGSAAISIAPWIAASLIGGMYFALLGWAIHRCYSRGWLWLIPLVWAGMDVLRSTLGFLAFPWALTATPLWPIPSLGQLAHVGTIHLVSAWVVLVNVVFALFLMDTPWKALRRYGMIALGGMVASFMIFSNESPTENKTVVLGQVGVDLAFVDRQAAVSDLSRAVDQIFTVAALNGADLTILPEGLTNGGDTIPPLTPFNVPDGIPVLFGGQRGVGPTYQSAFAKDSKGNWSYADKSRLVAFGEYVPGRDWIPFLSYFNLPAGDLQAGSFVKTLKIDGLDVGPLICFEALFWDVAEAQLRGGAKLLAVMSLDDWFIGTPAPDQLRAAAVWRAIETGLPVVRVAPLGYTMAIDGHGNVIEEAPTMKTVGMRAEVPVPLKTDILLYRSAVPWLLLMSWALLFVPVRKATEP